MQFIPDAGARTGYGHVGRCIALAQAFSTLSFDVVFVLADPAARRIVREHGFPVASRSTTADVTVIDSYRRPMDLVRALAAKSRRLAAIDDLHQLSHAEVKWIIRPSVGERSSARVLGGARFVLLRREWWQLRRRAPRESVRGVFIALGSAPQHRDLVTAVEAVRRTVPEAVIDVASGIRTFDAPSGVRSHPMSRSLRPLLAHVDLAVSAAGQTMYECLASRVPTVVVCTAENQRRQLAATMRAGAALDGGTAGSDGWNEALMATVARLLPAARRVRMTAHQEALIDGRGALRVARALAEAAE